MFGVGGRRHGFVRVVGGSIFCEQLRCAIADIVGMGKAEVDEERSCVIFFFPFAEVIEHAISMPGGAGFVSAAAFRCIVDDAELFVRGGVAVALFAGAHGGVSGAVEDGTNGVCLKIRRAILRSLADRQPPDRATTHDHVPRGRADRACEGTHVMGGIEDHATGGDAVDIRRLKGGLRVVELEVEGRLVVDKDEEDVRPALLSGLR